MTFGLAPSTWSGKINSPNESWPLKSQATSWLIAVGLKIWSAWGGNVSAVSSALPIILSAGAGLVCWFRASRNQGEFEAFAHGGARVSKIQIIAPMRRPQCPLVG